MRGASQMASSATCGSFHALNSNLKSINGTETVINLHHTSTLTFNRLQTTEEKNYADKYSLN